MLEQSSAAAFKLQIEVQCFGAACITNAVPSVELKAELHALP